MTETLITVADEHIEGKLTKQRLGLLALSCNLAVDNVESARAISDFLHSRTDEGVSAPVLRVLAHYMERRDSEFQERTLVERFQDFIPAAKLETSAAYNGMILGLAEAGCLPQTIQSASDAYTFISEEQKSLPLFVALNIARITHEGGRRTMAKHLFGAPKDHLAHGMPDLLWHLKLSQNRDVLPLGNSEIREIAMWVRPVPSLMATRIDGANNCVNSIFMMMGINERGPYEEDLIVGAAPVQGLKDRYIDLRGALRLLNHYTSDSSLEALLTDRDIARLKRAIMAGLVAREGPENAQKVFDREGTKNVLGYHWAHPSTNDMPIMLTLLGGYVNNLQGLNSTDWWANGRWWINLKAREDLLPTDIMHAGSDLAQAYLIKGSLASIEKGLRIVCELKPVNLKGDAQGMFTLRRSLEHLVNVCTNMPTYEDLRERSPTGPGMPRKMWEELNIEAMNRLLEVHGKSWGHRGLIWRLFSTVAGLDSPEVMKRTVALDHTALVTQFQTLQHQFVNIPSGTLVHIGLRLMQTCWMHGQPDTADMIFEKVMAAYFGKHRLHWWEIFTPKTILQQRDPQRLLSFLEQEGVHLQLKDDQMHALENLISLQNMNGPGRVYSSVQDTTEFNKTWTDLISTVRALPAASEMALHAPEMFDVRRPSSLSGLVSYTDIRSWRLAFLYSVMFSPSYCELPAFLPDVNPELVQPIVNIIREESMFDPHGTQKFITTMVEKATQSGPTQPYKAPAWSELIVPQNHLPWPKAFCLFNRFWIGILLPPFASGMKNLRRVADEDVHLMRQAMLCHTTVGHVASVWQQLPPALLETIARRFDMIRGLYGNRDKPIPAHILRPFLDEVYRVRPEIMGSESPEHPPMNPSPVEFVLDMGGLDGAQVDLAVITHASAPQISQAPLVAYCLSAADSVAIAKMQLVPSQFPTLHRSSGLYDEDPYLRRLIDTVLEARWLLTAEGCSKILETMTVALKSSGHTPLWMGHIARSLLRKDAKDLEARRCGKKVDQSKKKYAQEPIAMALCIGAARQIKDPRLPHLLCQMGGLLEVHLSKHGTDKQAQSNPLLHAMCAPKTRTREIIGTIVKAHGADFPRLSAVYKHAVSKQLDLDRPSAGKGQPMRKSP
eukprot:Clim_evm23s108 gene=Clim_evmTU23s108